MVPVVLLVCLRGICSAHRTEDPETQSRRHSTARAQPWPTSKSKLSHSVCLSVVLSHLRSRPALPLSTRSAIYTKHPDKFAVSLTSLSVCHRRISTMVPHNFSIWFVSIFYPPFFNLFCSLPSLSLLYTYVFLFFIQKVELKSPQSHKDIVK